MLLMVLFGMLLFTSAAEARQGGTLGDSDIRLYTFGGTVSLQSHGYSSTRVGNLREPLGGLATANLNFSVLGFSSGLNIRYSTDNSRLRQDMNEVSFNGGWRWVQLAAGDVSPGLNRYSLRGTRIRGAHLELTPGALRLEAAGGRVNRRVTGLDDSESAFGRSALRQSYERWLYAGRLGLGRKNGNHFYLGVVYAWDEDEELPEIEGGRPRPRPEENLLVSPDFQLSFFDRRFQIEAQNAVSVFSRDTRAEALDLSEAGLPSFLEGIFTPRTSTRVNFATQVQSRIDLSPLNLNLGFERIQPGFRSMGLRNVNDDMQNITVQPQLRLLQGRLNLSTNMRFGRDNILNQRTATQRRTDFGLNAQTQITNNFSLSAGYNRLVNRTEISAPAGDDPTFDYPEQSVISQNFSIQPAYAWSEGSQTHAIAMSANYQVLDVQIDNSDRDLGNTFFSANGTYSLSFTSGLNFNTNLMMARGDAPASDFRNWGLNVGVGHSFFDRKLSVNLNGGFAQNRTETEAGGELRVQAQQQLTGNFTMMYRPIRSNTIRLTARTINNQITEGAGRAFQELEVRLSISQRF
ncbi:hypothetical protein CYPRO_0094 [Cyclonatronum proteinivorum]|uniref:TIGR03016 family PEP-CTERM system-associated outer membrane protein n=2 Tax=Cyclonatronum proteinivorum TaxID=1457365 RepID=A0A345UFY0_9BACT|nr:hypothetical protein CYPRO_0094 [Cyclonatronum proteinivorum]